MKTIHTLLLFSLFLNLKSQTPFPNEGFVFDDELLPRIDISMSADDLNTMFDPSNAADDVLWPTTFMMSNGNKTDTVENVGIRLRGNTSLNAAKKSFKISFNTFVPGRKYKGLEKLNINGEHNDPSIIRSKLCWDLCEKMTIPASRSNHVQLYINGDYFGLYINVEHIDEEFVKLRFGGNGNLYKCLWPATLEYLGSDPDLYKLESGGRRTYELKTNTTEDDYSDLAHFIDVLNNTSDENLQCELEKVFNVQSYLKSIAMDILTANWDGPIYNKNNFYLYHNPSTGKFEYIPYDLDNTFGIQWFGEWTDRNIYTWAQSGEPRPIYNRIIQNDTYRRQFTFYINRFLENPFNETAFFAEIDLLKNMIEGAVENDPFYPLDYGFTIDDFNNSYTNGLEITHAPIGLKEYILQRRASALDQLENTNAPPIINHVKNNFPSEMQEILITAKVEDEASPEVLVYYEIDGTGTSSVEMFDDGNHQDGAANDGIFGAIIPALNQSAEFTYYIKATDESSNTNRFPFCERFSINITTSEPLYINEFMARNDSTIADEFDGYDDWIEIYNGGSEAIYLGDKYMTDDLNNPVKWLMPDESIQAGEFLIVWADNEVNQGAWHANFKLSSGGEEIGIFDADGGQIDAVVFDTLGIDEALGRLPNGTGVFQEVTPTPGASNEPLSTYQPLSESIKLVLFPNPSFGNISVSIENTKALTFNLTLTNLLGNTVWKSESQNAQEFNENLDLNAFPKGIYLLTVQLEDGSVKVKRVVLQ
jgi:CotH kinase protein/Lamin Tail Domain/Secretion system C-terminal sorting domain